MEYYSAIKRNKYEPAELRWMNLEPIIVKENKHYMLIHVFGIQKNGTDESLCRAGIEMWM